MTVSYEFNSGSRLLHMHATVPTSIEDFQNIIPEIIEQISGYSDVLLLLEVDAIVENERFKGHDLGFYFLNQIKNNVARFAIACPLQLTLSTNELVQVLRNHQRPAEVFQSAIEARDWLLQ